jgi:hypothetical protein
MNKRTIISVLLGACLSLSASAWAGDAALTLSGDLIIHPNQMSNFFAYAADEIRNSTAWDWPALTFTSPYKTAWTQIQAVGPFDIQFDSSGLASQQLSFTLNWAQPQLSVGNFEIHDTITRDVGGAQINVHLDGTCTNMILQIPGGQWQVQGTMLWDLNAQSFTISWVSFNLQMAKSVTPIVNLGKCAGEPALLQMLHDTILSMTEDQAWLQDVLQQGLANWLQGTLGNMQTELLTPRQIALKPALSLAWQPSGLERLPGGMLHVPGTMALTQAGSTVGANAVARNYDPSILQAATESGFVLPKDTLSAAVNYLFANGELVDRIDSTQVSAFESLMQSRFFQFFVWPDLLSFRESTKFYFDLTTQSAPQIGAGKMLVNGGSSFPYTAPMLAHQWAPANSAYLPYIDFTAPLSGLLTAKIQNGNLTLQMSQGGEMKLQSYFRPEFAATRSENTWLATSLIGSNVRSYLNSTPFSFALSSWSVGTGLALQMVDIQAQDQTFNIPINFVATQP